MNRRNVSLILPRISSTICSTLHQVGWEHARQVGSHLTLRHPKLTQKIVVPVHAGEALAPKTSPTILDPAGLTADDLRELSEERAMSHQDTIVLEPD